jgi:hypothetical protein
VNLEILFANEDIMEIFFWLFLVVNRLVSDAIKKREADKYAKQQMAIRANLDARVEKNKKSNT